jgi:hypothetical protein
VWGRETGRYFCLALLVRGWDTVSCVGERDR